MKKLLASIAVSFGIAATSSAVSVDWSSTALSFLGSNLKNDANVTGYLVYLGKNGTLASSYTVDGTFDATTIGTVVNTDDDGSNKGSKVTSTYSFDYGTKVNDDAFALLVSYTKDGTTYWNLSSTVNKLSGISDETATPAFTNFTMATGPSSADSIGSTLTAGGGWAKAATAVPEPGTAALALLGIGMLIKRRRA